MAAAGASRSVTRPTWTPLRDDRDGALALIDAVAAEDRAAGRDEEAGYLASSRPEVERGTVPGALVRDPEGEPWGLAAWRTIGDLGRTVAPLLLAKKHRTPDGWRGLLSMVVETPDPSGPVLLLNDRLAGRPESETAQVLVPRGFSAFHRYGLVFPPGTPLPPGPARPLMRGRLRPVGPSDLEPLARLSAVCYAGSIDRFLFTNVSDPVEGARSLLRTLFDGRYGEYLEGSSFGLEIDGELLGAALVTRARDGKLLADVSVHPDLQGQGHARRLIRACLETAAREPTLPVRLAVTRENVRAFRLYRDLGFVIEKGPGTLWANTTALGIPRPSPAGEAEGPAPP